MSSEFKNRKVKRILDREAREKKNAYERARRSAHGHRWMKIKSRYGITQSDFDEMVAQQGGRCACCRERLPIDVDHSHRTNRIRGILCRACNIGIGLLGDDLDGLMRAVEYLKKGD